MEFHQFVLSESELPPILFASGGKSDPGKMLSYVLFMHFHISPSRFTLSLLYSLIFGDFPPPLISPFLLSVHVAPRAPSERPDERGGCDA